VYNSGGRDLNEEHVECIEGSALSTLSNALVKLKEPPPTRPLRAGEMGDEVAPTKSVVVRHAVMSTLGSDRDTEPSGTVSHLEAAEKNPVKLVQSTYMSAPF